MSLIIRALIPSWSLHPRDPIESQWPSKEPHLQILSRWGKGFQYVDVQGTKTFSSVRMSLCLHLASPDSPISSEESL